VNPPHIDDGDVRIWHGDAIDCLRAMPAGIAQTCITSPPFWGLRDYGVDGQIGLEPDPDQWVARLVDVFREVRRVLRDDGTLWLEVGDSYAARGNTGGMDSLSQPHQAIGAKGWRSAPEGMKNKDLVGAPWLLAFALRQDGWYLRSDIIWARPNPMPESVTDRPTKAHSYVFLLTKRPRYFMDMEAIREDAKPWNEGRMSASAMDGFRAGKVERRPQREKQYDEIKGANSRTVWTIATEPTPFAHFATFPQELVRRCILAGTSERGACPNCGAPWARQTEKEIDHGGRRTHNSTAPAGGIGRSQAAARIADGHMAGWSKVTTTGWAPTCTCDAGAPVPQVVCDPFMGSGTTALVARHHGRHAIGCELNASYLDICRTRLQQLSLLGEVS
jgi:DNA modification methylase